MSSREDYAPGAASGAEIRKDGEKWTLVLVRDLPHPPAKVWKALTEPEHLREWAPFDSDRSLGAVGTAKLTTVGAPTPLVSETQVKRADAPKLLEFNWGGQDIRWQLEPQGGGGTRLTLWHNIDRRFISMGAAGWHICFDVMERLLAGQPIGRMVGAETMKFSGWQRLNAEYARQFGVELPQLVGGPELAMPRSKGMVIGFWIATALFCLQIGFTAYAQLRLPQVARMFTHLGFPAYFRVELSWAKLLGVVLLLAPVSARLKEWAYAGFAITLASALIAHFAMGDE